MSGDRVRIWWPFWQREGTPICPVVLSPLNQRINDWMNECYFLGPGPNVNNHSARILLQCCMSWRKCQSALPYSCPALQGAISTYNMHFGLRFEKLSTILKAVSKQVWVFATVFVSLFLFILLLCWVDGVKTFLNGLGKATLKKKNRLELLTLTWYQKAPEV